MQSDYFASGGWQKLIETLLRLDAAIPHEVPSKTPDVPGHDDYTVECPLMTQSGHRSLSGSLSLSSCRRLVWLHN
jgi:hypothetical protein